MNLKDNMKTSWQIKEWVAKSLPHVDVNWSEAHFDKWLDEYDEFHSRDSTLWVKFNDVKDTVLKINSIKFGWSSTKLGFDNCDCQSKLRVLEFQNKKCNLCYDCLIKDILGDWEK